MWSPGTVVILKVLTQVAALCVKLRHMKPKGQLFFIVYGPFQNLQICTALKSIVYSKSLRDINFVLSNYGIKTIDNYLK